MLFIPLLILAIVLYIVGRRVSSVLLFFFFCTDGFQLVPYPEVLFDTHLGISKAYDFALLYALFLFVYGLIRYDDFLPRNFMTRLIGLFTLLLAVLVGVSLFYYHVPLGEVLRTVRPFLLVYAYFSLRRLTYEQYNKVIYALWLITFGQCLLFVVQSVVGIPMLNNALGGYHANAFFYRFYNYPRLLYLAAFLSWFAGYPFGAPVLRRVALVLFTVSVYLTFSRAALAEYLFLVAAGYVLKMARNQWRLLIVGIPAFLLFLSALAFVMLKQQGGRTATDIQNVLAGDFVEVAQSEAGAEFSIEADATFIFRMALVFERLLNVISSPDGILFGRGLSAEGSPYTDSHFGFYIGLSNPETGGVVQLDSSDISWGSLFLRYGLVGTLLYVTGFFCLAFYFLHSRKRLARLYGTADAAVAPTSLGLSLFLFMMMIFLNSLVSDSLYTIVYFLPVVLFVDRPYLFAGNGEFEEKKSFAFLS